MDDTYINGTDYYYPVEVTVYNDGASAAGQFYVKLEVYWINGSLNEGSHEILIFDLASGTSAVANFSNLFHPMHTGYYRLTATVDIRNNVTEENELNNILVKDNVAVAVMGDLNGDGTVNVLDAVRLGLVWGAYPWDPRWDASADLNHDLHIDILDGVKLGLHWNQTW
jgi:hypothetical protein